jgi:hypothetical protein
MLICSTEERDKWFAILPTFKKLLGLWEQERPILCGNNIVPETCWLLWTASVASKGLIS